MLLTTGIRALQIVLVLACVGMLWSGVSAALGRSPVEEIELPPPRPAADRDTSFARYAAISQRDLFGSSQPDGAEVIEAVSLDEDLPEASLPYLLVGTVAMSDPKLSLATLAHQSRRDERGAYRVGDRLAEGHRIVGIDKRRIVVEKDGTRAQLRMDDDPDVAASGRRGGAAAARKAATARISPDERRAAARRRAAERRATQRAEQLRRLREEQERDDQGDDEPSGPPPGSARLESLMNSMRMNPVQGDDGELEGVRIESVDPDGPFAELEEGTVCFEMNGIHLSQMHVAIQSLSDDEPACMKCRLPSGQETITCF